MYFLGQSKTEDMNQEPIEGVCKSKHRKHFILVIDFISYNFISYKHIGNVNPFLNWQCIY